MYFHIDSKYYYDDNASNVSLQCQWNFKMKGMKERKRKKSGWETINLIRNLSLDIGNQDTTQGWNFLWKSGEQRRSRGVIEATWQSIGRSPLHDRFFVQLRDDKPRRITRRWLQLILQRLLSLSHKLCARLCSSVPTCLLRNTITVFVPLVRSNNYSHRDVTFITVS